MADILKREGSWNERNRALKILKLTGKFGWMHLVVAERRSDKQKILRLKKYMNWFSIPDPYYLAAVQRMLKKGAQELGWEYDESQEVKISTITESEAKADASDQTNKEIPAEIIEFVKEYPDFTKKLIGINLESQDSNYMFDLLKIIDIAVSKSGERLKVALKDVIEKISKENEKGMNELSDLMEKLNLQQIVSLANIIKGRLETIDTFEQMIQNEKTYEINTDKSIHRLLEKSMWLVDENYWIVQSNRTLRTFIGEELSKKDEEYKDKRPDFACVDAGNKLLIIEIKRPSIELKKKELDQAEMYQRIIKKYQGTKHYGIEIYLVGNRVSDEAREIIEYRKGVQILTYQELIASCRRRYQEYLRIIEGGE